MQEQTQTRSETIRMIFVYGMLGAAMGGMSYLLNPQGGGDQMRIILMTYVVFLLYIVFDFRLPVTVKYQNMFITSGYVVGAIFGLLLSHSTMPQHTPMVIGIMFVGYYFLGVGLSWRKVS